MPARSERWNRILTTLGRLARHLIWLWCLVFFVMGVGIASLLMWTPSPAANGDGSGDAQAASAEKAATIWTCSMHPQIRQPGPGLCPICAMDLIPVAKTSGGLRTLTVSPETRALMEIEAAPVERRYVDHEIRMVGKVDYDETRLGYITAWVPGRLDRLYVDYSGVSVRRGDHMVYMYSEELYVTQDELLQALKFEAERRNNPPLVRSQINPVESARAKLRNYGLTDEQIREIEQRGTPSYHMEILAPVSGVVIEKLKQEGERVALGDRIYTIADLSRLWVHLDAYEADLPWIRYGQKVVITTEAYPGDFFPGQISFIQPVLNDKTRTVKVRVNVPNPEGKLKPEMFVHAVVRPKVAAGGKVMDRTLAGKWISPMHPEIVKDQPGTCDICGIPLVRAETLGYVTPDTDAQPPLVIPYSAALVTGTRAVVYVELPPMHSAAEPAFLTLSTVVEEGDMEKIRRAFATFGKMLDQPYDQKGTQYARDLWDAVADELGRLALAGTRAANKKQAEEVVGQIEATMNRAREVFAPPGQPTFEGREILLGPRAGDYYLVSNGLREGEMVVTHGNFKIDAEIQLQAKPSMMTPEAGESHEGHQMALPTEFADQVLAVAELLPDVTEAVESGDLSRIRQAFKAVHEALQLVDGSALEGMPRTLWKEFAMLLSNDAVEGAEAKSLEEVDRVYLSLKSHLRRVRGQLGVKPSSEPMVERVAVTPEFQAQLAKLWRVYVTMGNALASDDLPQSRGQIEPLKSALGTVNDASLTGPARTLWGKEQVNLTKIIGRLEAAKDIAAFREAFKPFSEEMTVLAKAFGFGPSETVFLLHCPMAFQGQGAIWLQDNDQARNPYYGASMLRCADRVEPLDGGRPPTSEHEGHGQP